MKSLNTEGSVIQQASDLLFEATDRVLDVAGFGHRTIEGGPAQKNNPSVDSTGKIYTARERRERQVISCYATVTTLGMVTCGLLERSGVI